MNKNYKRNFKVFENSFLKKKKEYFLEQGYKYRLIMFYTMTTSNTGSQSQIKQKFQVGIEDLQTGIFYKEEKFHWRTSVMNKFHKFINQIKK